MQLLGLVLELLGLVLELPKLKVLSIKVCDGTVIFRFFDFMALLIIKS